MEDSSDVVKQLQRLNLTGEVKRLIWNVLVSRGLYAGNPSVSRGYYYRESEVLNMRDKLLPNFINTLGLNLKVNELIAAKRSEAFPFTDLPLMANIRNNDLIDPTIGMPKRAEYFKLDTFGNGDYFAPQPGLWENLKEFRTTNVDDMIPKPRDGRRREYPLVPVLIYGSFRGSEFGDDVAHRLGLSIGTNKFVSLGYTNYSFNFDRTFRTVVNVYDPKQILDPKSRHGSITDAKLANWIHLPYIKSPGRESLDYYLGRNHEFTAIINIGTFRTDKNLEVQLIVLDKATVDQAKLILPSLRDDVVVI